jgi:hypothetical protein
MSQIIKNNSGGGPPVAVQTTFLTDYDSAFNFGGITTTVLNQENVFGGFSAVDNDNGIATRANPDGGQNLFVILTNRVFGVGTTVGASTITLITVPLGIALASYRFQVEVVGIDTVSGDSVGYTVFGSVKTDGVTASVVETPYTDVDQDPSLVDATIAFVSSGNNGLLQVTGVVGRTITYKAVGTYIVVSL